jgi:peptidoglycan/xylan/chitin deacetylase (PgdA/CDA1 family)
MIILIGAIIVYLFVLRGIFGKFNPGDLIPSSSVVKSVVEGGEPTIGILYSKYTENMFAEGSTWLNDNITTWKKFLDNSKLRYDIISDADIELGRHIKYQMLVLPGSRSLSDKEISQLKKYIDRGGSVFATSGIASYSSDGKWRGWEFISQVFGLEFSKEIENDDITKIHTLRGGLPLTANIPTGFPLKVATWDRPMSVKVLDPRTTQVSFWYNYRLEDGLVREEVKKSAGIVYGTYNKGRFVWMGFEINSVIGVQEDYVYFEKLFNNCINWLTYGPVAYIKDWPTGFRAAAMIAPTLKEDVENVNYLLDVLRSERAPVTFFVSPLEAEARPNLIKSLSRYGEVAAIVDVGYLTSVNDTVNQLDDYDIQYDKLANARSAIEKATGAKTFGSIPYYGLFDPNTIKAAIDAGYKYVLTDSLTDRSVPKTIIRGENRIITMTKTARDDYEVIRDFGLTAPEFQFYTYQEDIDRVLFEGGMYIFKFHTDYQCQPANVNVVRDVIRDLKKKGFWIATGTEIQEWFAKKDYIEMRTEKRGETRVALIVSNPGVKTINQLVVEVDLNDPARNIMLNTEIIGTKPARFEHKEGSKVLFLHIDDLKPKESRTYYIDYDKPNA